VCELIILNQLSISDDLSQIGKEKYFANMPEEFVKCARFWHIWHIFEQIIEWLGSKFERYLINKTSVFYVFKE
jgi:hypothetical protein